MPVGICYDSFVSRSMDMDYMGMRVNCNVSRDSNADVCARLNEPVLFTAGLALCFYDSFWI